MDKPTFYNSIRLSLFAQGLKASQVTGIESLLDRGTGETLDLRWIAYILATTYHETARTMQPIEEYGHGHGRPYGVPDPVTHQTYYGRGFVQLTWKSNYQKFGDLLHVDLVDNPALALDLTTATDIIMLGMTRGLFTGKGLADYFTTATSDWYNARRIVNGLDSAQLIANYAAAFYKALLLASGAAAQHPASNETFAGQINPDDYVQHEANALLSYNVAGLV